MDFPTYISMPMKQKIALPEEYGFLDVRYAPELVEYLISKYSSEGDAVFDPFVGFGTSVMVAERLKRKGYGIELDEKKIDYMHKYLGLNEQIIHGDVNRLFLDRILPPIDLVITSPPYMGRTETADALSGYKFAGDYANYLDKLQGIFLKIQTCMNPGGKIILEVSNLRHEEEKTTLAWDIGIKLAEGLKFEGEIIVNWTGERSEQGIYNYGYDHSYCLVYSSS